MELNCHVTIAQRTIHTTENIPQSYMGMQNTDWTSTP